MNAESKVRSAPSINGHMITLGAGHSIAIHERSGEGFVAKFREGRGELPYAGSWPRFDAGACGPSGDALLSDAIRSFEPFGA